MELIITRRDHFEEMLTKGEIKTSWTQLERYGIDDVISAAFEEQLNYKRIGVATYMNRGVLEAYLYDGVECMEGVVVDRAYIHKNGDVVLVGDDYDLVFIIKNKDTSIQDFITNKRRSW